jgi:hypothetical protein
MNYTQLVTQIQDYMETTFDTDSVNTFIKQAENKIYNSVQIPSLRRNSQGNLSQDNEYLQCPDDFLAVYSLALIKQNGEYVYLLNKDVNYIRQVYPIRSVTGQPKYYAIFGPMVVNQVPTNELSLILGPTPNAGYNVELHYFYKPDSIVDTSTSWLGDNFDNALLYGALREAYLFIKGEPDLVASVEAKYQEAMLLLKQLGDGKERQDAYRSGQVRYPVQ